MPTQVSFNKAVDKLRALGNVLHRPLRDVLDSGARTAAVSCARSAVPYGTGAEAKSLGEHAVVRDIYRVYATPGQAYEDISGIKQKKAFWKAYKAGEIDVAEQLLSDWGSKLAGVPFEDFDDGAAHRSARNSRGRVNQSRPSMVVIKTKELIRYIKKEMDAVGFAKGGFADCVRAIGHHSPRGLREEGDITANWITRKAHGYGKAFRGGSDESPSIQIRNEVPYADKTLAGGAKESALRIARQRMIENLQIAVRAEARNLRSAA